MRFRTDEERKGFSPIRNVISDIVKELKLEDSFYVGIIKEKWEQIAGSIIATHSVPVKKNGRVLVVEADHPVFANDITMMKKMIMEKIRSVCGNQDVDDIKVIIGKTVLKRSSK